MAEKTTKKTTATKATTTAKKTTAAAKPVAAKRTAAAKAAAVATKPAVRKTVVRKRAASTVSSGAAAVPSGTGWRRFTRKTKVGVVMSAKQARTVIVVVERQREHPLYKKVVRVRKRFAAHDEAGDVREGDLVRIQESRPYSATKRWRVVEVISRIGEAGAAAPRVGDIEKALEEAEGVSALLAKPESVTEKETEEVSR